MSSESFVINPRAKINPRRPPNLEERCDPADADRWVITAPRRGHPFKRHQVLKTEQPQLFDALLELYRADEQLEIESELLETFLIESGFFVPEKEISEPVSYACYFDADARSVPNVDFVLPELSELIVNPGLIFQEGSEPPLELARELGPFLAGGPLLWVNDAATEISAPYWAKDRGRPLLAQLKPGLPAPEVHDRELLFGLVAAKILVPRDQTRRAAEYRALLAEAAAKHTERGYVLFEELLPRLHIRALFRYYTQLIEQGMVPFGDVQVDRRWFLPSEPVSEFWQAQVTGRLGAICGRKLKTAFSYFVRYEEGAVLDPHVDRLAAEFTLSLQLGFEPLLADRVPWSVNLDLNRPRRESVALHLAIGEGLFYRGHELRHSRPPLAAGNRSSTLLFHFADQSFDGEIR